jgi:hypothetical protein
MNIDKIIIVVIFIIIIYLLVKYIANNAKEYPKIIWMYWDTEKKPEVIKKIIKHNDSRLKNWDIRFLNAQTVYNYIPKEEFPNGYDKLMPAHKADWIRMYLLNIYGGCWMDASIIINSPTVMDELYDKSLNTQADLTVFKADLLDKNKYTFIHSSGILLPLYIENWFIYAPKNSILIKLWLEEYTRAIKMGFTEYKKKAIEENVISVVFSNDEDVYLTQHLCIQYVLQKRIKDLPRILFLDALESMLKIRSLPRFVK